MTPTVRRNIYLTMTLLGLAVGAANVGYSSIDHSIPEWLTFATAIVTFLAGPTGILAALNTPARDGEVVVSEVVEADELH